MADEVSSAEKNTAMTDIFASSSSAVAAVEGVFGPAAAVAAATATAATVGAANAPSGAWSFDREQIDAVIHKWEDLRDDLGKDRQALDALLQSFISPSDDEASSGYSRQVMEGLSSLQESNESMAAYVSDFTDRLIQARDGIEQADSTNSDSFRSGKGS